MENGEIDSVGGTGSAAGAADEHRPRRAVPRWLPATWLTSTDHDVPYPAGCRRPGNPTRGPKPTSGSRAGEFCTVGYPPLRPSTAGAAVLALRDSD